MHGALMKGMLSEQPVIAGILKFFAQNRIKQKSSLQTGHVVAIEYAFYNEKEEECVIQHCGWKTVPQKSCFNTIKM